VLTVPQDREVSLPFWTPLRPCCKAAVFFSVYSYSHASYLDYGAFFFVYSLLACDLGRSWRGYVPRGGSLQASLCPPPRPVPREVDAHRMKRQPKGQRREHKECTPVPYSSPAEATKGGVGRNSGCSPPPRSSPAPSTSASAPSPLPSPGTRGAPVPAPRSPRPLRPQVAPAFTHPWWRGSPAPPGCISRRPSVPGSSTDSSTAPCLS